MATVIDVQELPRIDETPELPPAGFVSRAVALSIDAVVVGVALSLAAFTVDMIVSMISLRSEPRLDEGWVAVIAAGVGTMFALIYHVACWRFTGRTLGKAVMGLQVEGRDGGRISVGRGIVRFLSYFVSSLFLGAGFLWVIVDRKHRAWHDLVAGTRVVYLPNVTGGRLVAAAVSRFESTSVARR